MWHPCPIQTKIKTTKNISRLSYFFCFFFKCVKKDRGKYSNGIIYSEGNLIETKSANPHWFTFWNSIKTDFFNKQNDSAQHLDIQGVGEKVQVLEEFELNIRVIEKFECAKPAEKGKWSKKFLTAFFVILISARLPSSP